jgi:two-component system, LytTR family, response regulator
MHKSFLHCILIDDDDSNLRLLQKKIVQTNLPVQVLGSYTDPELALHDILLHPPDLLITDIEMPGLTGFELISAIRHLKIPVIFATAFESYALRAIKFSAMDYLLKPINLTELREALEKALQASLQAGHAQQQEIAQQFITTAVAQNEAFEQIVINTQEKAYIIPIKDIIQIEASHVYSLISDGSGKVYTSSKPIQHYEELLKDYGFFRCHRSYLINTRQVVQVDKDGTLLMYNGFKATINKELISTLITKLGRK